MAITLNIDANEKLLTSFLMNLPSNYFPIPFHNKGEYCDCKECRGKYTLIQDEEDPRVLKFHKPLPCYGCGIGWCSLLLGCLCPLLWYIATVLYFCKYYNRDPRERDGLVACAFAALICTVAISITIAVLFL